MSAPGPETKKGRPTKGLPGPARPRSRRAAGLGAGLAVAVAFAACADADGPGGEGPVGEASGRLTSGNGLRDNGLRDNGLRDNGLRDNGLRDNGLSTLAFKAWFDKDRALGDNVMTYVARCALGPTQVLKYTDGSGKAYSWPGSLGLAPEWATRAATVAEQEWVSACLMAFTNKCGNQVTISLRGPSEGAPETERFPLEAGEREGWTYQEAAFFGNLFTATPDLNACDGGGGQDQAQLGLGRECGSDDKNCGYVARGACASVCVPSQNADGYYKSCAANGRAYTRVVTTYLDPNTWRGSMDCRNKGLDDDRLSAGAFHACARAPSGQPACWGQNRYGQLGDGTTVNRHVPKAVEGLPKAVQLTAGSYGTCVRSESGSIACWGENGTSVAGEAVNVIAGVAGAVHASGGSGHTCARAQGGAVYCWGDNNYGQLGTADGSVDRRTPQLVSGLGNAVEVALGAVHSCARLADNTVRCWGNNSYGQLGNGTTKSSSTPVAVPGLADVVQIAPGWRHTCARLASGAVYCWGENADGQLGDGSKTRRTLPVPVAGLAGAVKVTGGYFHTCAAKADGSAACWGANSYGQAGTGDTASRVVPAPVVDLSDVEDVAAGGYFSCARKRGGAVFCWGDNYYGQLGIGVADKVAHPRPLAVKFSP
jgi:alpha-tubulin suppressor-like RCC1 family protein